MLALLVAITLIKNRARLVSLVTGFVERGVADVGLAGAVVCVVGHIGCECTSV